MAIRMSTDQPGLLLLGTHNYINQYDYPSLKLECVKNDISLFFVLKFACSVQMSKKKMKSNCLELLEYPLATLQYPPISPHYLELRTQPAIPAENIHVMLPCVLRTAASCCLMAERLCGHCHWR